MSAALEESVLIVIDAQIGFVNEASAPAVPVIADVLSRWQAAGGLSVLTQFVNRPESNYVDLIGWLAMMPGDRGVGFVPEVAFLAPNASLIVEKTTYSGLTAEVASFIEKNERRHLWIAGLDTESCVLATAVGAFDHGLIPWVLTDATASHAGAAVHEAGLLVMRRNLGIGQLITTAEAPPWSPTHRRAWAVAEARRGATTRP